MMVVRMNKIDVGTFGEVYKLTIGNIEKASDPSIEITISEGDAEKLKPLFSHHKKTGKFNQHEEWI